MRASFRILQKIWDKKKGRRPCNQVTNKDPHRTPVWDLFARHAQWSTNDSIHGMSCRPRVSLPFIPSTCLIPTDTSRNTTHVWIKNCSIKILYASCSHHNDRLWLAARDNRKAGSILCARITAGDSTEVAINRYTVGGCQERSIISRGEFVKLHIVTDVKGRKIVSCVVTRGCAHDSPVFRFHLTQRSPFLQIALHLWMWR